MAAITKWLPVVDVSKCSGCGRCVNVCGLKLRRVVNGVAIIERAYACPGEGLCQVACQTHALTMGWVPIEEGDAPCAEPA